MLLRDNGPVSSVDEDLKALGLANIFEQSGSTTKTTKTTDEEPAAPRTEVGVRQEGDCASDMKDKMSKSDEKNDEKDEKDGDEDEEGEETEEQLDPEFLSVLEDVLALEDDEIDALDDETTEQVAEFLASFVGEDEDPKYDAALDVLASFYAALNEDDAASPDEATLIGVIEAFEYLADANGTLDEAVSSAVKRAAKKNLKKARKKATRLKKRGKVTRETAKMQKRGKVRVAGNWVRGSGAMKAARSAFKGAHGAKGRLRMKAKMAALKSDTDEQALVGGNSSSISELVDNLNSLREAVTSNAQQAEGSEQLKEGFDSIVATAKTWMESIANEVKSSIAESNGEVDENDPRIGMGRHLEQIAIDGEKLAALAESGECDLDKLAEDLQSLAADLDDAAGVMKQID